MDNQSTDTFFEKTFQQHWPWVCQTLYRLVEDWDEAEDLALQVFTKLHKNPPSDLDKVPGWLHRVAVNTGYNALRSRHRRLHYETTAGLQHIQQSASAGQAAI